MYSLKSVFFILIFQFLISFYSIGQVAKSVVSIDSTEILTKDSTKEYYNLGYINVLKSKSIESISKVEIDEIYANLNGRKKSCRVHAKLHGNNRRFISILCKFG
jgi:hypothetical protein